MRIVVPPSMRPNMLAQIHESHLGITKCKQRAREALFWPGMTQQIENLVSDCAACNTYQNKQHAETLRPMRTPDLPWVEVATDIFEWERSNYLVTVDYYSKFIEVDKLENLSSAATIDALKSQMSRHGIAEKLRSDNGSRLANLRFSAKITKSTITRRRPHFRNLTAQRNEQYRLSSDFGVSVRTNTWLCWTTERRRLKVVICHQPSYAWVAGLEISYPLQGNFSDRLSTTWLNWDAA